MMLNMESLSKNIISNYTHSVGLELRESDNYRHGSIMIHLIDDEVCEHLDGYYLLEIMANDKEQGMMRYRDIGEREDDEYVLPCIDIDNKNRLKIIGVDVI